MNHEALYQALKTMVEETMAHAKKPEVQKQRGYSRKKWRNEFHTVRFGVSRRMGHTVAALRLAHEMPGTLLVVASEDHLDAAKALCKRHGFRVPLMSVSGDSLKDTCFRIVIFDTHFWLTQKKKEHLLNKIHGDPLVLLLQ